MSHFGGVLRTFEQCFAGVDTSAQFTNFNIHPRYARFENKMHHTLMKKMIGAGHACSRVWIHLQISADPTGKPTLHPHPSGSRHPYLYHPTTDVTRTGTRTCPTIAQTHEMNGHASSHRLKRWILIRNHKRITTSSIPKSGRTLPGTAHQSRTEAIPRIVDSENY